MSGGRLGNAVLDEIAHNVLDDEIAHNDFSWKKTALKQFDASSEVSFHTQFKP